MKKAIVAASYDPITWGHLNIIDRALQVFDHVLVGIGINNAKKYTFSLEERENLTRYTLQKYGDRVSVKSYEGLLSDFAYENQISTIIRGARNTIDFDFERALSDINQSFRQGIDTYLLIADQKLSHVSSSAAKDLQRNQAKNLLEYVPLTIKRALEIKLSGQYLVGVTGVIGSGKSFVTEKLIECHSSTKSDIQCHNIDLDEVGRFILTDSTEPVHMAIREKLHHTLDLNLVNGKVDMPELLKIVFDTPNPPTRGYFEDIMSEPIFHVLRKRLFGLKGLIFINSALFVAADFCPFVNNHLILVDCPYDIRVQRLLKRGYTMEQVNDRIAMQKDAAAQAKAIQESIDKHSCGQLVTFPNDGENSIELLYSHIIQGGFLKL
jgi:pantetheine-phosphate adenylyltransferase